MVSFQSTTEFYEECQDKISTLKAKFEGYTVEISKKRIQDYLCQFELNHKPIALKMLEKVDYYSNARTSRLTKKLGNKLKRATSNTFEDVYFCPINRSSGSSTSVVIQKLRNYTGMNASRHDNKFIFVVDLERFALDPQSEISNLQEEIAHINNLPNDVISESGVKISNIQSQIASLEERSRDTPKKTVVFVDDYVGSGRSFCKFWAEIGSYHNENNDYILACLVAHQQGISIIESETPVRVVTATVPLSNSERVFHSTNKKFTDGEKNILKSYCDRMKSKPQDRYGFMDTQSLVIMFAGSANNVLPILYSNKNNWLPLFPRYL